MHNGLLICCLIQSKSKSPNSIIGQWCLRIASNEAGITCVQLFVQTLSKLLRHLQPAKSMLNNSNHHQHIHTCTHTTDAHPTEYRHTLHVSSYNRCTDLVSTGILYTCMHTTHTYMYLYITHLLIELTHLQSKYRHTLHIYSHNRYTHREVQAHFMPVHSKMEG